MATIRVSKLDDTTYSVTVQAETETTHAVTVTEKVYQALTGGTVTPEALIEESFRFLLEHESNTMIFPRFYLTLIGQYFPEYEREIKKRLAT